MSKVDWSLAPEGTTHKDVGLHGLWYRFDFENNLVCYWNHRAWQMSGTPKEYDDGSMNHLESRPKQKPSWSGPQDGLPPVGTVCEIHYENRDWVECEIVAHKHFSDMGRPHAIAWINGDTLDQSQGLRFRAIKTPEQLAAEQRETAIREIMDIADVDCRVTAARLVDAGFKREVV